ncbi:MAG: DUF342 domain-containing protein [Limnochordaceae bacterium]|nr:DUF342 domain-containing protein [Limnochordaceae bacterium]
MRELPSHPSPPSSEGSSGREPPAPDPGSIRLDDILTPEERQRLARPAATPSQGMAPASSRPPEQGTGPAQGGPAPAAASGGGAGTHLARPTLVEIVGGALRVLPGDPDGARPVIEPGPHVSVRVNGKPVTGPYRLDPSDVVEVQPDVTPPQASVTVQVSQDLMQAHLIIQRSPGVRYRLDDVAPTLHLRLEGRPAEEEPPPPVTLAEVEEALRKASVRFGIDGQAIQRALAEPPGEPVLVAQGEPAVEPVDGKVELKFEERSRASVNLQAERIDLFDRGAITWVEPETVLAVITLPQEGRPGTNVLGRTVPVRRAKAASIKAGKGCRASEDGTRIVATQAGRPQLSGSVISVVPVYEVQGNVDVATGHVRFAGDVHVRGDVMENLEVTAGGEVRVGGLVSYAKILAGGGVSVGRSIIGSRIRAGGPEAAAHEVLPVCTAVARQLDEVLENVRQLSAQAAATGIRVPEGELLKRLLERRFWDLPKQARKLAKMGERLEAIRAGGHRLAERTAALLVGTGPLRLSGLQELAEISAELQEIVATLDGSEARQANVEAFSVQNSHIECNGRIVVRGSGCFNSVMVAALGFEARRGVVRGGQVTVTEGDVVVRELGGPTGVPTTVTVVRRGKVTAALVHPHVTISIGGQKHQFHDGARSLRASLSHDGKLVVDHLRADPEQGPRPRVGLGPVGEPPEGE